MFLPTDAVRRAAIIGQMPSTPPAIAAEIMRVMGEFDASTLAKVTVPVVSIGSASPPTRPLTAPPVPGDHLGQTVGAGHFNQLEVPEQVTP